MFAGGIPAIDIGDEQHRLVRSADSKRDRVRKLVPVRHRDRRHFEAREWLERNAHGELRESDLPELIELAPGAMAAQEGGESRGNVDWCSARGGDFAAEVGKAEVVADVSVGQQDGIDRLAPTVGRLAEFVQQSDLGLDGGGRFDQQQAASFRVVQAQARWVAPAAWIAPCFDAARLLAAKVGHRAVLSDTEDEQGEATAGVGLQSADHPRLARLIGRGRDPRRARAPSGHKHEAPEHQADPPESLNRGDVGRAGPSHRVIVTARADGLHGQAYRAVLLRASTGSHVYAARVARQSPGLLFMSVMVLTALAAGFFGGRFSVLAPLGQRLSAMHEGATVGQLVSDRAAAASVYLEPQAAEGQLDSYSWNVLQSPAPFVGHLPAPGRHDNATINALSGRGERLPQLPRPAGVWRVFLTGGSTAYGSGASSDQQTIGAHLERALNESLSEVQGLLPETQRVEVFTFACPGWTSTHERILITNRLVDLQPDCIVSLSGVNDVRWAQLKRNVLWMRSYYDELWFGLLNEVHRLVGEPLLPDLAWQEPVPASAELVWQRLDRNLRQIRSVLAPKNCRYVFALQPVVHVSQKPLSDRERGLSFDVGEPEFYRSRCGLLRDRLGPKRGSVDRLERRIRRCCGNRRGVP